MSLETAIVRSVLLCDDIRHENNGKVILIGVYSTEIGIKNIPGKARFKAAIIIDIPSAGEYLLSFKVVDKSDGSTMEAQVGFTTTEASNNVLMQGFEFGMDVLSPSTIQVQYKENDWSDVGHWSLRSMSDETEQM